MATKVVKPDIVKKTAVKQAKNATPENKKKEAGKADASPVIEEPALSGATKNKAAKDKLLNTTLSKALAGDSSALNRSGAVSRKPTEDHHHASFGKKADKKGKAADNCSSANLSKIASKGDDDKSQITASKRNKK